MNSENSIIETTAPVVMDTLPEVIPEAIVTTADPAVTEAIPGETTEQVGGVQIEFNPNGFVEQLPKMGTGMLGIFIVIGIIIVATGLINFIFKPRKK